MVTDGAMRREPALMDQRSRQHTHTRPRRGHRPARSPPPPGPLAAPAAAGIADTAAAKNGDSVDVGDEIHATSGTVGA